MHLVKIFNVFNIMCFLEHMCISVLIIVKDMMYFQETEFQENKYINFFTKQIFQRAIITRKRFKFIKLFLI